MSAPDNAKPLGYAGWLDADNKPLTKEQVKADPMFRVRCSCGWKGHVGQLLAVDEEDTMWCPQCQSIGWEYD